MSNINIEPIKKSKQIQYNRSCFRIVGISCAIILLILSVMIFLVYRTFKKNPSVSNLSVCIQNMAQLNGAINRYVEKKGDYPAQLNDIYPNFLDKKECMHCPADTSTSKETNYEYAKPEKNSKPETVIIKCKRHKLMKSDVWLFLQKNGKIKQYILQPGSNNEPIPGAEIDVNTLSP